MRLQRVLKTYSLLRSAIEPGANVHIDFQHVDKWDENKLDRTQSSRMGWTDVALCLAGPVVQDLRTHFSQRWSVMSCTKCM